MRQHEPFIDVDCIERTSRHPGHQQVTRMTSCQQMRNHARRARPFLGPNARQLLQNHARDAFHYGVRIQTKFTLPSAQFRSTGLN